MAAAIVVVSTLATLATLALRTDPVQRVTPNWLRAIGTTVTAFRSG